MIEKKRLGNTELVVSKIGFGGIPIQSVAEKDAIETVKYAYKNGINFFDSARAYTTSEEKIGKALKENRNDVILASKFKIKELDSLEQDFYTSLSNFETDYLDLYQFHNITEDSELEMLIYNSLIMDFLYSLKKKNIIRYIGVTTHRSSLLLKIMDLNIFDTIQFPFNYIENEPLEKIIPKAIRLGVGQIGMKPLAGGVFQNNTAALKWLMKCKSVIPIPGMCSIIEVKENIDASYHDINEEEMEQLNTDSSQLKNNFCRRCNYCLPCPNGVNPSFIIKARLNFDRHGWHTLNKSHVEIFEKGLECVQCGTCEDRCPYNLPLTELVKTESEELLKIVKSILKNNAKDNS